MKINKLTNREIPERLQRLYDVPKQLFCTVNEAALATLLTTPCLAIVGSRKVSTYGRQVTTELAAAAARQGITIISGLAFGVDAIAHRATLEAGGRTIAVLPSPLESIYPATNQQLAAQIAEQGGALVSEYPAGIDVQKWNFIGRNRLIAGLAEVVLITEAAERSGSLHTANFALEQGKTVLAVPGNTTSPTSVGTNNLIQDGAGLVTSVDDILLAFGLQSSSTKTPAVGNNPAEQTILNLLSQGITAGDALQQASQLPISSFQQALTMLEVSGTIQSLGSNHWTRR